MKPDMHFTLKHNACRKFGVVRNMGQETGCGSEPCARRGAARFLANSDDRISDRHYAESGRPSLLDDV
jgi:hypothetical protein